MATEDHSGRLKNLPPEILAGIKARRDQRQGVAALRDEEFARRFKFRHSVIFSYGTPQGHINPNSDVFTIAQWSDDYGNTVYTQRGSKEAYPPEDEIGALSQRIQTQQATFDSLDPSEQTRIKAGGADNRFTDYLNNAALATQFQKLK